MHVQNANSVGVFSLSIFQSWNGRSKRNRLWYLLTIFRACFGCVFYSGNAKLKGIIVWRASYMHSTALRTGKKPTKVFHGEHVSSFSICYLKYEKICAVQLWIKKQLQRHKCSLLIHYGSISLKEVYGLLSTLGNVRVKVRFLQRFWSIWISIFFPSGY